MKNVVLLGSTGSIGTSTIKVVNDLPEHLRLVGLAAGNNIQRLSEQAFRHQPEALCVMDQAKAEELRKIGLHAKIFSGPEGLIKLATLPSADIVLIAIVGPAGLQPALAAIRAGKDIAVASKEILVMAGQIRDGRGAQTWRSRPGGGLGAFRDFSMPRWQTTHIGSQIVAHRFGWSFPDHAPGGISNDHGRARAKASFLGNGQKNHH